MKKLISILLLIIAVTSCEKKSCYECTVFKLYNYYHNPIKSKFVSSEDTYCGMTAKEANEWEEYHTKTDSVKIGSPGEHYVYEESGICLNKDW